MDKIRLNVNTSRELRRRSLPKSVKNNKEIDRLDSSDYCVVDVVKPKDCHTVTCLDDWTRNMHCPQIYSKAAILLQHLNKLKDEKDVTLPSFFNEFERKRAYGIAFAAKRHAAVLKEVLADSSFSYAYFELLGIHEPTVLIMLMDFYDHKFNEKYIMKKCDYHKEHFLEHVEEIANTLYKNRVKLSAAFARQRVEYCAPSLEEMLPEEEKEQRKHASQHPVYVRVNTLLIERKDVMATLELKGFKFLSKMPQNVEMEGRFYCPDEHYQALLTFPKHVKDDIYCMELALQHQLIPQSKSRYIVAELVRNCLNEVIVHRLPSTQSLSELLSHTKLEPVHANEVDHVLITHPEMGALSSHICSFLDKNKKLLICGGNSRSGEEMQHMLKKVGANNFAFLSEAFCDISPTNEYLKFCKVVICNPPCSKSGIVNLVDFILYEGLSAGVPLSKAEMKPKLPDLVQAQTATLNHAFRLPGVQQIVYCTFSNNTNENEGVIDHVLRKDNAPFEVSPILSNIVSCLYPPNINGNKVSHLSLPPSDKMNGFFLTLLKRKGELFHLKVQNMIKKKSQMNAEKKKLKMKKKKNKSSANEGSKGDVVSLRLSKKDVLKKGGSKKVLSKSHSKMVVKRSLRRKPSTLSTIAPTVPDDTESTLVVGSDEETTEETDRSVGDRFKF